MFDCRFSPPKKRQPEIRLCSQADARAPNNHLVSLVEIRRHKAREIHVRASIYGIFSRISADKSLNKSPEPITITI